MTSPITCAPRARVAVVLAFAALACAPLTARAAEERAVTYSDTVRVSASKLGSRLADLATTINLVTPAQLRLSTLQRTQQALATVPGVNVLDLTGSGSGGAVEARGFAAQGTTSAMLVLVDGIPLNDFEAGRVDWNSIAPSQVRRVEYLRGPSSFLYGSATMAGLVNLVTYTRGEGVTQWAQVSGGSFGAGDASVGASWGGARAQGSVSAAVSRLDGWRDNSAARFSTGYASGRVQVSDAWDLRGRLLAHAGDQRQPGALTQSEWDASATQTTTPADDRVDHTLDGALELTGRLSPSLELVVLAGGQARHVDAHETVLFQPLDRTSAIAAGRTEARLHWTSAAYHDLDVLVGGEYRGGRLRSRYFDDVRAGSQVAAADVNRTAGGLFGVARLPLANGFAVTGGARVDWTRASVDDPTNADPRGPHDDLRAVSPNAALSWSMPGHGQAWVSYAGAFKAPELEQLYDARPYWFDFGSGPVGPFTISNHALEPQRDDHWEAGGRLRVGGAWLEGAGYYARVRDEIGFNYDTFSHANIARSRHQGVEAQLVMPPVNGVSGSLSAAWTKATFDGGENDGKQINSVPERTAFARLSYEHAHGGAVSVELQYVARQWADEGNTAAIPDYTLLNVGVTQPMRGFELFGAVRNLTDESYASLGYVVIEPMYFPAAGRSFSAGVRMRFSD
ncbi:MAG: TonB-dependent receptor [Candidatus Eisenbacteria bacterium]